MNDIRLKRALEARVQAVTPSDDLLMNVKREVNRRKKEREKMSATMKKVIAIAAMACLICASCFAASQFTTTQMGTVEKITRYDQLADAAKEIGLEARYVEKFENGFAFQSGDTTKGCAINEEGVPVGDEYEGLAISYVNAEGERLTLIVEPTTEAGGEKPAYSDDTYKFVPPDYELTEEDKAMMDGGDFFISYGSQEVEIKEAEVYSWQDGNISYSLTAFDCNFGEAEMARMARELMGE